MNFLELAKKRYTTKKYASDRKISNKEIEELKEILQLSPSSINSQPWKFIFVSDHDMKQKLAVVSSFNGEKINDASHVVVFSALDNIELFEKQIKEYLPEGNINYYFTNVKAKGEAFTKSWLQHQVYLSLGYFLSACASLGIDSTPMEGISNEEFDEILELKDYKTLFAVAIGYRNPEDTNQPNITSKQRLPIDQVIQSI